jgi:hypothetical protein
LCLALLTQTIISAAVRQARYKLRTAAAFLRVHLRARCNLPALSPNVTRAAEMTVIDWARLLRCTECGVRDADFVVAGGDRWA